MKKGSAELTNYFSIRLLSLNYELLPWEDLLGANRENDIVLTL